MLTCALSGGACATERARLQPPDGGGVHVVGSRHVCLRLASLKPRQSLLPLVWRDAGRSFRSYASFRLTAFPTSGAWLLEGRLARGSIAPRHRPRPCFAASSDSEMLGEIVIRRPCRRSSRPKRKSINGRPGRRGLNMRILAFSDIHNNVACVRKLRAQETNSYDVITIPGDIGTYRAA